MKINTRIFNSISLFVLPVAICGLIITGHPSRLFAHKPSPIIPSAIQFTAQNRPDTVHEIWLDELNIKAFSEGPRYIWSGADVDGRVMRMKGIDYPRGICVGTVSVLPFQLSGHALEFKALAGPDDIGRKGAPIRFYVLGDARILFESGPMYPGDQPKPVRVSLKGIQRAGLLVVEGESGFNPDHLPTIRTPANWANARFVMEGAHLPEQVPNDGERYILTPPAAASPKINAPRVFGATPGNPFLFTIATTGERPLHFSALHLPEGLTLDSHTGIITGKLFQKGVYDVTLKAKNKHGEAVAKLKIKIGDTIALTPPIGWNGWNSWAREIDREKVISSAEAMVQSGLRDHGWTYINIDDAWQGMRGGPFNAIQPNEKFPRFKEMIDTIHGMGLKAGIYSTPWITSYAGYTGGSSDLESGAFPDSVRDNKRRFRYTGKYLFDKNDARQMAEWGIDYLKYDWRLDVPTAESMAKALKASGRDILYSLSNSASFEHAKDWARFSNTWRTGGDIRDSWISLYVSAFTIDKWAPFAGPGHWNDPDMLILGNVTTGSPLHPTRLTPDEQYSHVSLFSLLAAPLLIGCPIEQLDAFTLNLLTNDEVIAINQDPLGKPGRLLARESGVEIWAKPMEDGSYAVGLFNTDGYGTSAPSFFRWGNEKPRAFSFDFNKAGLTGVWKLRDAWTQKDLGIFNGSFQTTIPHHGVRLIRMFPVTPAPTGLRTDLLLNTARVTKAGLPTGQTLGTTSSDSVQYPRLFSTHPSFSWEIDTAVKKVTAWRILLASSPSLLDSGKADIWDHRKTVNAHSGSSGQNAPKAPSLLNSGLHPAGATPVVYSGPPLHPGKIYYWKIAIWDENGRPSGFSSPVSFYMSAPDSSGSFAHYPLHAEWEQPLTVVDKGAGSYFADFGKDALAQIKLRLTGRQSDTVWIEVGEALAAAHRIDSNPGRNIRFMRLPLPLKTGTHDYTLTWPANEKRNSRSPIQMPDYIGEVFPFRYISLQGVKGKLEKEALQRKTVFYPFDETASAFSSDDTILNQVWDLCKYTIKATSFTGYYVDGDRERIPYEADALINQRSHYAVDAEYSMARRTMEYLLFHPTWPTEWSLQNIPLAWNDYLYTGDPSFIRKYYSELQKKLLMPLAGENGLISTRTGKQSPEFLRSIHILKPFDNKTGLVDIVDWPQGGGYTGTEKEYPGETDGFVFTTYNSVVNAWYYHSLVLMQQIAAALGKPSDQQFYRKKAELVYQSYQQVFRDAQTGLIKDGDSTRHTSLHSNMFALAFGLVPEKDKANLIRFLKSRRMACSVYGAQFLLDALFDQGEDDYAIELLSDTSQRSWYNMIRAGSTITLEAWDKLYKPNLDWNHAWGAAPANLIVTRLMGITPLSPGFGSLQIMPRLGNIREAHVKAPTLKGELSVWVKKTSLADTMRVIIPGDTVADIYMPVAQHRTSLLVNGKKHPLRPEKGYVALRNREPGEQVIVLY